MSNETQTPSRKTPPSPPPGRPAQADENALAGINFVVQFGDAKNSTFSWPPDLSLLRGWWKRSNIPGMTCNERFDPMPDIPGLCLHFKGDQRRVTIFDPLGDPRNADLLAKAQEVVEAAFQAKQGPEPARTIDLDDDEAKTWLYWVRRFLDAKKVKVERGSVPEMDEIENLPGRFTLDCYDTSSADPESRKHARLPRKYRKPTADQVATGPTQYDVVIG